MPTVMIIAPWIDIPTTMSSISVKRILEFAYSIPNLDIDYLPGALANRAYFHACLSQKRYDLICYWGHGYPDKLSGNHILWSIINKKNIGKLQGTIIDSMACYSASELGPYAIENGVRAYVGTTEPYWLGFPEKENDFYDDWDDYTSIRQKMLLQGYSVGEAYNAFVKKSTNYINKYKLNYTYRNYDYYLEKTMLNRNNTILLGDKSARLEN